MKTLKEILFWLWQLPQNLLGLLLLGWYKIFNNVEKYHENNGRKFYWTEEMPSGISLGNYIIFRRKSWYPDLNHEYGHSRQSRMLGPLYLLLIGLPSISGNIFDRLFHKKWKVMDRYHWYFNQPWEKWADKLGGVIRD